MFVQPISLSTSYFGMNTKNHIKVSNRPEFTNIHKKDSFNPSFEGFNTLMETFSSINYTKDNKLEDTFSILFNELLLSGDVLKKAGFSEIENIYRKSGFRGLLHELWKATPQPNLEKLIEKADGESVVLASKDDKPVFEIFSMGRHGFWNTVFNKKSAPRDTKLIFITPDEKYLMEFGLDEKGACQICQKRVGETVYTTFHNSTGNRKIVAIHPHSSGNPETYYYKPDGSDDELKNHFQGGSVINIW